MLVPLGATKRNVRTERKRKGKIGIVIERYNMLRSGLLYQKTPVSWQYCRFYVNLAILFHIFCSICTLSCDTIAGLVRLCLWLKDSLCPASRNGTWCFSEKSGPSTTFCVFSIESFIPTTPTRHHFHFYASLLFRSKCFNYLINFSDFLEQK